MNNPVYMKDGRVVFVMREFDDGTALVADAYEDYEGELYASDNSRLVELNTLSDKPPVEAYSKEIVALVERRKELRQQVREEEQELAALKKQREDLFKKAKLELLDKFVNGGITHYVQVEKWGVPKILQFSETVDSYNKYERGLRRMKMLSLFGKSDGDLEWRLNSYNDSSGSDAAVIPCTSEKEAQQVLREQIALRMESKVSTDLLKAARNAGMEVPDEYVEAVRQQAVATAERNVKDNRKKLAEAEAKVAEAKSAEY